MIINIKEVINFKIYEVKSKFFILKNHICYEGCFSFAFPVVIHKFLQSSKMF